MSNTLEEKFGALCDSPWTPSPINNEHIIGRWAEDGSTYVVICPHQLRDQLIHLQNQVFRQLYGIRELKNELVGLERILTRALCE
jgi:hypothetical protein